MTDDEKLELLLTWFGPARRGVEYRLLDDPEMRKFCLKAYDALSLPGGFEIFCAMPIYTSGDNGRPAHFTWWGGHRGFPAIPPHWRIPGSDIQYATWEEALAASNLT